MGGGKGGGGGGSGGKGKLGAMGEEGGKRRVLAVSFDFSFFSFLFLSLFSFFFVSYPSYFSSFLLHHHLVPKEKENKTIHPHHFTH